MRIKKIVFIVLALVIISVPIILYYFGGSIPTQEYIYESNWDIDIPSDYKLIYNSQDKHDFQGKGYRYTIFTVKEIDNSALITLPKNTNKIQIYNGNSSDSINNDIEEFVQTVASYVNISKGNEPEFEEYYLWQKLIKYGDTLVVIYFPNSNKVFFVEKLV